MTNHFVGTWNTSWTEASAGTSELNIAEDGSGTYSKGTLQGSFSDGNRSFSGQWKQGSSTGTFTFVLVGDAIAGAWGPAGGLWNGTRKS